MVTHMPIPDPDGQHRVLGPFMCRCRRACIRSGAGPPESGERRSGRRPPRRRRRSGCRPRQSNARPRRRGLLLGTAACVLVLVRGSHAILRLALQYGVSGADDGASTLAATGERGPALDNRRFWRRRRIWRASMRRPCRLPASAKRIPRCRGSPKWRRSSR